MNNLLAREVPIDMLSATTTLTMLGAHAIFLLVAFG